MREGDGVQGNLGETWERIMTFQMGQCLKEKSQGQLLAGSSQALGSFVINDVAKRAGGESSSYLVSSRHLSKNHSCVEVLINNSIPC